MFIVFFAKNKLCGVMLNLQLTSVLVNISYLISADSMHNYMAHGTLIYISFCLPSYTTFFMCSGFSPHMMSTNSPLILSNTNLPLGNLAFRYAPGTLKVPTSCHFYASRTIVENRASKYTVGNKIIFPYFRYLFYLLLLAYDLTLTLTYIFTFIKFNASNDCF